MLVVWRELTNSTAWKTKALVLTLWSPTIGNVASHCLLGSFDNSGEKLMNQRICGHIYHQVVKETWDSWSGSLTDHQT